VVAVTQLPLGVVLVELQTLAVAVAADTTVVPEETAVLELSFCDTNLDKLAHQQSLQ
jgi:hypothetical protein